MKIKVNIKKLTDTATTPTRGSEYAAGYDLYADIDREVTIRPHETVKIPTGIAFELPEGTFGAIFARSGLSTKEGVRPANCTGVCDSDYRGGVIVPLHNDFDTERTVTPQERIAQYVVLPFIEIEFEEVEELGETRRGAGGFGSTGRD